jgi:hypothetical protein
VFWQRHASGHLQTIKGSGQIYARVVAVDDGRGGCWDVLAWNGENVTFVECKRKMKTG